MNTQIFNGSIGTYLTEHPLLILVMVWSAVWKAIALWKSARNNHLIIFIVITVLNTVGIAEIIYLGYLYFKNKKTSTPTTPTPIV
jgi:hypothetical protein